MSSLETTAVLKEGASVVTSQLKLPERLKPTFCTTTCVLFDMDN